ncbi:MAG TPA: hypothetical protein ENF34_03350 [Candidatus Bathyarchaeota archaeon]|nr:hypothetical protein [Candidatus Bathyarchaeota archaeon]
MSVPLPEVAEAISTAITVLASMAGVVVRWAFQRIRGSGYPTTWGHALAELIIGVFATFTGLQLGIIQKGGDLMKTVFFGFFSVDIAESVFRRYSVPKHIAVAEGAIKDLEKVLAEAMLEAMEEKAGGG